MQIGRFLLLLFGVLLQNGIGTEYAVSVKNAETIMIVIFSVLTIALSFLIHGLVANGLSNTNVRFFSPKYYSTYPISIIIIIISIIFNYFFA